MVILYVCEPLKIPPRGERMSPKDQTWHTQLVARVCARAWVDRESHIILFDNQETQHKHTWKK